ncbi:NAD(P)-binding protein [Aspergillus crustosus]
MPSYAITGASRGIGWEFLRQLSADPANTVIGIVRNKPATEKRVTDELSGRRNIYILQGDLDDYDSLESAAASTATITGGGLDYLIANGAFLSSFDAFDPISELVKNRKEFDEYLTKIYKVNVIGNLHLFSLFTPLILKGTVKKVIHISTGHADPNWIRDLPVTTSAGYALTKAATNIVTDKFAAEFGKGKHGVLFMNICPGYVETGTIGPLTPEQLVKVAPLAELFQRSAPPSYKGPRQPEEPVKDLLAVIERSTVDKDSGTFVSHKGDQVWLS